jgi:hypothetical protein
MAIVIPVVNTRHICAKLLHDLLFSISNGGYTDQVIVCFDGTDRFFVNYFKQRFPFITAIHNPAKPFGFAKNANAGLNYVATQLNEGCFLINMDTVLPHSRFLYQIRNEGVASPEQIDASDALSVNGLNQLNDEIGEVVAKDVNRIRGFCMWISRQALDKIGLLDDGFIATFEDDDYTIRAKLSGLPTQQFNVKVHHYTKNRPTGPGIIATTTGAYDGFRLFTAERRFKLKWGIPQGVVHDYDDDFEGERQPTYAEWILENHNWKDEMKIETLGVTYNAK